MIGRARWALLVCATVILGGCERSCRPGTLFLDVDLGPAAGADTLYVDVAVGSTSKHNVQTLAAGSSKGSVEIQFPNGYPAGATATVMLTALRSGTVLAQTARAIQLASGCAHESIALGSADGGAAGAGGATGTGGATGRGGSGGGGAGGGRGGSGGGGGAGGAATCSLVPDTNGYIAAASNTARVQGAFYTFTSDGSTIAPMTSLTAPFTNAGDGRMCVRGNVGQVLDGDFMRHFGAGVGFDLCSAPAGAMPLGSCSLGTSVTGLRFRLSGADIPPELRVTFYDPTATNSTYVLAFPGVNVARFADGVVLYTPSAVPTNAAGVQAVTFSIPATGDIATPFDFCVDQMEVVNGGACSAAGTGGTGGAPGVTYAFAGSTEGFALNTFAEPNNLATPGASATPPTLTFDGLDGNPVLGSLRVGATFTANQQYADVVLSFPSSIDLTGRLVRVKVKLDAGSFPGYIALHASSSNFQAYTNGTLVSPVAGRWYDLYLDMRTVDDVGWSSSSVVQIGVQFNAAGTPGVALPAPVSAGFHIDTISY